MLKTAEIVFEDEWILVVNKHAGVVVNRSETVGEGTLQDDVAQYLGLAVGELGIGGRAGIVHRLDKETSGLLVIGKTQKVFDFLQAQFKNREVSKEYAALVHGKANADLGTVDTKIARVGSFGKFGVVNRREEGREATTDYEVSARYVFDTEKFDKILKQVQDDGFGLTKARSNYLKRQARDYVLFNVFPKTGRTHQIRVHLKSIGHPVVSDLIYGPNKLIAFDLLWCPRLFLHAKSLEFVHPKSKKRVKFEHDLPQELNRALEHLTINT